MDAGASPWQRYRVVTAPPEMERFVVAEFDRLQTAARRRWPTTMPEWRMRITPCSSVAPPLMVVAEADSTPPTICVAPLLLTALFFDSDNALRLTELVIPLEHILPAGCIDHGSLDGSDPSCLGERQPQDWRAWSATADRQVRPIFDQFVNSVDYVLLRALLRYGAAPPLPPAEVDRRTGEILQYNNKKSDLGPLVAALASFSKADMGMERPGDATDYMP
jgi:hypothetical protein